LISRDEKAVDFKPFKSISPSFYRADLSGAHLNEIRVFMLVNPAAFYVISEYFERAIGFGAMELTFREGLPSNRLLSLPPLEPDGTRKPIAATDAFESDQADFQSDLRFAFLEANLSGAGVPNGFLDILKIKFPPRFDLRRGFESRYPASGELDWDCKTRVLP
jgi:hypothetical protein